MSLQPIYQHFLNALNHKNVNWCLIKDYDYLMKTGYDNEIDLVALGKDREKIRKFARETKWNESGLNGVNTHLIFWKFEDTKPFRVDIHLDKALATAIPWLKAKDILANKIRKGSLWVVSPAYELAILIMAGLRGREPKPHRTKRAIQLKQYTEEAKAILGSHLSSEEFDSYYSKLARGTRSKRLSTAERLGISGILRQFLLYPRLLLARNKNRAPVIVLRGKNREHVASELITLLGNAKLNVVRTNFLVFLHRLTCDLVITTKPAPTPYSYESVTNIIPKIISDLYGDTNVH